MYLDGGEVPVGKASTIVDLTSDVPRILRAGAISVEALRTVVDNIAAEDIAVAGS